MSVTDLIKEWPALTEPEMMKLAQNIAAALRSGDVLGLSGDLGSGKTTMARAMIQSISPEPVDVTSPTFTLMQEYPSTKGPLLHCDLYRLESEGDVYSIGLLEMLDDHITLIEWPGIIVSLLPASTLHIKCAIDSDKNARRVTLSGVGDWKKRLSI